MSDLNPCQRCGACCMTYRVSFYSGEVDDMPGGWVPARFVDQIGPNRACMQGTVDSPVRCRALTGQLGQEVGCTIYEFRPSPCREFAPFAVHGRSDVRCDEARRRYGLPPLDATEAPISPSYGD